MHVHICVYIKEVLYRKSNQVNAIECDEVSAILGSWSENIPLSIDI